MRRVLQVCGMAAALAVLGYVHVSVTGAQGIISGVVLPPIAGVTPGMPLGVTVSVPNVPNMPIMSGISVGMAGTGSGSEREVIYKESTRSEPATIVLSE